MTFGLGLALAAAAVMFASWALVAAAGRVARRSGFYDMPTNRGMHNQPTPRVGGVPIVILTVVAGIVAWTPTLSTLLAVAMGVAILGFIDDVRSLPSTFRFAVQSLCATVAVWIAVFFSPNTFDAATIVLYLFWIIGLTNAFNFMDGSDGIAGGQALVAGLGWMTLGFIGSERHVIIIGAVVAASAIGFLIHNWQPASIFMGDAGSTFLGFLFAVLPLTIQERPIVALVEGGLLVWPFVLDSALTFGKRLLRHENVFMPHRSHIYQRLILTGMPHARVALLYIALAVPGVAAAALIRARLMFAATLTCGALLLVTVVLLAVVRFYERRAATSAAIPSGSETDGTKA